MPIFSVTFDATIQALARANNDLLPMGGTATAASGSTTQLTIAGEIGALPAGSLIGSEIYTNGGTGSGQSLRVTGHTVSSGTATLTFPTATALSTDTTFYILHAGGKGFYRNQYKDAVYAAIDAANQKTFTDTSNISLAIERGSGGTTLRGQKRWEYPLPSGFLYLWGVDVLRERPLEAHHCGYLNTTRAFGDAAGRTRVGQGFRLDQQALVAYIAVYMGKVGTPTDNLTCVVETDSSGEPSTTAVTNGTSDVVVGTTLHERLRYVVFSFTPPILLQESTTYHFTLRRSGVSDASNYYIVGEDDGNNYPNGTLSTRDASDWNPVAGSDLLFAISPQADWATLAKSNWEYRPQSTDSLLLRTQGFVEGTPVQLRGGAAISRPASDSTEVPLDPDFVQNYALMWLRGNSAGLIVPESGAAGAAVAQQRWPLIQHPARPLPANAVRVY